MANIGPYEPSPNSGIDVSGTLETNPHYGLLNQPKTEVGMIDTGSAVSQVNKQNNYLNTTYPNLPPAEPSTPPAPTPTPSTASGKAYFTNEVGQEAEYTQDQLNDPNTQQYLKDNGFILVKSDGVNVNGDFSTGGIQKGVNDLNSQIEGLTKDFLSLNIDQDPEFIGQANVIKADFAKLKREMERTNQQRQKAYETLGYRTGATQYANAVQMGIEGEELRQGSERLANIAREEAGTLSAARLAFKNGKFQEFNMQVNALKDLRDQKQNELSNYNKSISDFTKRIQEEQKMLMDQQNQEFNQNLKVLEFKLNSDKFDSQQKKELFDQAMTNDKFTWQQKQDLISNALNEKKFDYQMRNDARDYALKLRAAERADTTEKYKDWVLAGSPGTYANWLMNNSNKPATADQEKNAGFALRMKEANSIIQSLTPQFQQLGVAKQFAQKNLPNFLNSPQGQQMTQAKRDFLNAVLRRESGAAISPTEFESGDKQYFPQPGDSQQVLNQKARNRQNALQGVVMSSGNALSDDFKNSLEKTMYSSVQQFRDLHPERWGELQNIIQSEGITNEIDALKIINNLENPNQPLSMGENGSEVKKVATAIGQFESGGNYKARGPVVTSGPYKGQQALGKYQVMPGNVASWTKEALGYSLTPEEFLKDQAAQDAVAEHRMGKLLAQYGNIEDVASVWFSGRPLKKAGNAKDVTGTTVPKYVRNVRSIYDKLG